VLPDAMTALREAKTPWQIGLRQPCWAHKRTTEKLIFRIFDPVVVIAAGLHNGVAASMPRPLLTPARPTFGSIR
jgi:hypothetical protein